MVQACGPSKLATNLMLRISALLLTGLHLRVVYAASVAAWPVRLPGIKTRFVLSNVVNEGVGYHKMLSIKTI